MTANEIILDTKFSQYGSIDDKKVGGVVLLFSFKIINEMRFSMLDFHATFISFVKILFTLPFYRFHKGIIMPSATKN